MQIHRPGSLAVAAQVRIGLPVVIIFFFVEVVLLITKTHESLPVGDLPSESHDLTGSLIFLI